MRKIYSAIEISELIARDMSGQLNQEEKEALERWLNSSLQNQKVYRRILDNSNFKMRNTIFEKIEIDQAWNDISVILNNQIRKRSFPLPLKYAAAILIPVLLAVSVFWYLNEKPGNNFLQISEIVPGTPNAVLVMANGEKVNLANDANEDLVEHDGTVIKNSHYELSYTDSPPKSYNDILLNTLIVPRAGEYNLVLSDSTRVYVNSMSKLVYPVGFSGDKREVTLEGEAYFEVVKDITKPFIVTINGMKVEVLGTSFNIKAYNDDKQSFTTLLQGKVKLISESQTSGSCFLEPNQQAVFDPFSSKVIIQNVDAKQFVQWTTGMYSFVDQSLDEIMKTLSRWYDFNYTFENEDLKRIKFEGGLNKYESIDPILDIIRKTGKVKVTVTGKDVLFTNI